MDNCDLEKLALSGINLCPWFKPDLTLYTATVASHIREVTLDVLTSDCGASYVILFGNGSKCLKLDEGLNQIDIEVTAEDGTTKKYHIELTKLSSTAAKLTDLTINAYDKLHPDFSSDVNEYSCKSFLYLKSSTYPDQT
ncbi:putative membrane protein Bcell_0381 [Hemibagrus wyckioides]|uniref:putative membrane protein Bcell_0381 n=1 Tax=Hemibagrus wyckioides TaxID=337641 RepID=UPI00266D00A7|nr:putative membrane protein Bcell_0381 [Hemibagrus wyckioides]